VAVPDRGLGAAGVGTTLSYTHFPPSLPAGLGAGLRAHLVADPVPDGSGAWLDDAISTRLTLDDGVARITLAPARDPRTFARALRIESSGERLPFPWDNGFANIVDIERRPDGQLAVTATNLDPLGDGTSQTLLVGERPPSSGVPEVQFAWDRDDRSESDSSCWVRVSQQWSGAGLAGLHLPEIGDAVVVSFLEGDPDKPFVVGNVYNSGRLTSPQPVDPRRDIWTIRTSSGGGFLNEFASDPTRSSSTAPGRSTSTRSGTGTPGSNCAFARSSRPTSGDSSSRRDTCSRSTHSRWPASAAVTSPRCCTSKSRSATPRAHSSIPFEARGAGWPPSECPRTRRANTLGCPRR
jgi:Type VI secretion system/phage-baseplate injector OB domain